MSTKTTTLKKLGIFNPHSERVKTPLFQNSSFFDPLDLLQVKYEMLRLVMVEGTSKKAAAELFGVSRPTLYETEAAFAHSGLAGLLPQQRGPKEAHKLDTNVMTFIENYLRENKKLNAKVLTDLIKTHFNISVHPRSVERAIARKKKFRKTRE